MQEGTSPRSNDGRVALGSEVRPQLVYHELVVLVLGQTRDYDDTDGVVQRGEEDGERPAVGSKFGLRCEFLKALNFISGD